MYPFIRDGEVILVKPVKICEVRIGDIIFYCTSQARMVAHRVIKTCKKNGEMGLMTKGDFTPGFDPLVHSNNVLGKVVAVERKGKIIRLDKGLALLTSVFLAKISPFTLWAYPILRKAKHGLRWILSGIVRELQGLKIYHSLIKKFVRGEILYQIATPDDAYLLSRLYRYNQYLELDNHTEDLSEQFKSIEGSKYWLVAKKKDKIIGSVVITKFSKGGFRYTGWWLFSMLVSWRYRGMGIGEKLTKMACEIATKNGASKIKLLAFERSKPAINLYRKLGFHKISIPVLDKQLEEEAKKVLRRRIILAKDIKSG